MVLKTILLSSLFCTAFALQAQDNFNTVYSIRVVSYSKVFDSKNVLDKIGDLGLVRFENAEINTRVYLGNYLGKKTVQKILAQVKKRGYTSAYIVEDDFELTHSTGKYNSHTFQIGAFKTPNAHNLNYLEEDLKREFYFSYSKGVYRISVGLFHPTLTDSKEYNEGILDRIGPVAQNGFARQFRTIKP